MFLDMIVSLFIENMYPMIFWVARVAVFAAGLSRVRWELSSRPGGAISLNPDLTTPTPIGERARTTPDTPRSVTAFCSLANAPGPISIPFHLR